MINNIKNKMSILMFLLCFIFINLYLSISIIKASEITNNIVRLHVIANSDNVNDQIIKLKISEIVENYINLLDLKNKNSQETINILNNNKENILYLVNKELKNNNIDYSCSISIGKIYYNEEKESTIYYMDKGYYNSIKITLGNGNGKNFWDFISPSKENLNKLKKYETILPGLNNLTNSLNSPQKYSSKILELLK